MKGSISRSRCPEETAKHIQAVFRTTSLATEAILWFTTGNKLLSTGVATGYIRKGPLRDKYISRASATGNVTSANFEGHKDLLYLDVRVRDEIPIT